MGELVEVFKRARQLIEKPENWTREKYARDKDGFRCSYSSESATSFCVVGAALRAACEINLSLSIGVVKPLNEVSEQLYQCDAIHLNDTGTYEQVIDLLDRAIAKEERRSCHKS
jgi:hypothetical protein